MITKAIIEKVNSVLDENKNIVSYNYEVYIPIFLDGQNYSKKNLPLAVYAAAPGTELTKFNVGDLVYVATENYDLGTIVILGLVPYVSKQVKKVYSDRANGNINSSHDTSTELVINNVNSLNVNGTTKLNNTSKDDILIGDLSKSEKCVNGTEISYLKNVNSPIQEQIDSISNSSSEFINKVTGVEIEFIISSSIPQIDQIITIMKNTWTSKSGLLDSGAIYKFQYKKNSSNIYYWQLVINSKLIKEILTTSDLQNTYGIILDPSHVFVENDSFSIRITYPPMPISRGGTGVSSKDTFYNEYDLFKFKLVSSVPTIPERNTIYFIYGDS